MARTRSKPTAKTKEPSPEPAPSTVKPLPKSTTNPPKLFVLPKDTSKDARIVTLDNPANGTPSRYYFCPQKGFYEFTRIAAPKRDCKSWLITGDAESEPVDTEESGSVRIGSGYITSAADLFIATPIDLLFLILPALAPQSAKDTKQHFLALDDYLDKLSNSSHHWKVLLSQHPSWKDKVEKRMQAVCDTVTAADEIMYRLSHTKLSDVLVNKAHRMVKRGLPPSLEEKFVKTPLEVPVMSIRREDSTISVIDASTETSTGTTACTTTIETSSSSSSTTTTAITTPDDAPTPSTSTTTPPSDSQPTDSQPTPSTPPTIPPLLRLRTSLSYLTSYLPPTVATALPPLPLFTPLTTHLAHLSTLTAAAAAQRSISDNMTRKRAVQEDDERVAEREEKRRRKEEEERKKRAEGRGVRALRKVDTSGMKKMSAFFGKVERRG
ncbi:hypothetical protein IAQ61_002507 [Plenodomus lingam]|uniref:Ribonuclease H2 subunit B n=1 Tax=Leptosphaeria maculans (strain JN3 / isolate v23.1.3 / race Av1-4-5-6-7-8) TaxID=985895 RepID=E4ZIM1_LEPMJ|nr:hypothetical protein LEMA_P060760.1 [Plenodomus lingam JN3]KAH9877144.1 hypothetical protein IAQ61_002507 [Plenodomus lingam]CBX91042.1 hypothetical protein LEMA_P060760.1 [Plenodomus lingam JN3]